MTTDEIRAEAKAFRLKYDFDTAVAPDRHTLYMQFVGGPMFRKPANWPSYISYPEGIIAACTNIRLAKMLHSYEARSLGGAPFVATLRKAVAADATPILRARALYDQNIEPDWLEAYIKDIEDPAVLSWLTTTYEENTTSLNPLTLFGEPQAYTRAEISDAFNVQLSDQRFYAPEDYDRAFSPDDPRLKDAVCQHYVDRRQSIINHYDRLAACEIAREVRDIINRLGIKLDEDKRENT